MLVLLFGLSLPMGSFAGADHPELSDGDEAYSAENYEKALTLYQKDAELGVIVAQVNLAFMYLDGIGTKADPSKAAQWFAKAAEQGNREAQDNLALLLRDGNGIDKDLLQAAKWFILAGDQANQSALEKALSPEQIAQAKRLAEEWKAAYVKAKGRAF